MIAHSRSFIIGAALSAGLGIFVALSSEAEESTGVGRAQVRLSEVDNAESTLTTAMVKDRQGAEIGRVHGMTRGADGEIKTVQVTLGRPSATETGVVALDARDMVYLPQPNVILASVSREEASAMPRLAQ